MKSFFAVAAMATLALAAPVAQSVDGNLADNDLSKAFGALLSPFSGNSAKGNGNENGNGNTIPILSGNPIASGNDFLNGNKDNGNGNSFLPILNGNEGNFVAGSSSSSGSGSSDDGTDYSY